MLSFSGRPWIHYSPGSFDLELFLTPHSKKLEFQACTAKIRRVKRLKISHVSKLMKCLCFYSRPTSLSVTTFKFTHTIAPLHSYVSLLCTVLVLSNFMDISLLFLFSLFHLLKGIHDCSLSWLFLVWLQ